MKFFVTKFWATQGVLLIPGKIANTCPSMIECSGRYGFFHGEGKEWHRTEKAASARVVELAHKKLASIDKQRAKIEKTLVEHQAKLETG